MNWNEERAARAALTWINPIGDPGLAADVSYFGAAPLLDDIITNRNKLHTHGTPTAEQRPLWHRRATNLDVEQLKAAATQLELRFLMPGDDEWPTQLFELHQEHSELHQEPGATSSDIGDEPIGLWVKGAGHLAELCDRSVAIVGARACSKYGEQVTHQIAQELVNPYEPNPLTVISGGAYGIDAAAHKGALVFEGGTVAVVAGGLDHLYPSGNEPLFDRITETGLIVTETAPGILPARRGFLARNRLIAALAQGTVVVEASTRSGSMNTANWATQYGRAVMAVPGNVYAGIYQGTNQLIRRHQATLVASAEDIRETLEQHTQQFEVEQAGIEARKETLVEAAFPQVDHPTLSPAEHQLYVEQHQAATSVGQQIGREL